MPNTIDRSPNDRRDHHHVPHGQGHCPAHCRYCGPDAEAWGVGEIVVGLLSAVVAVVVWLARRPAAVLALALVAVTVWAVIGPR